MPSLLDVIRPLLSSCVVSSGLYLTWNKKLQVCKMTNCNKILNIKSRQQRPRPDRSWWQLDPPDRPGPHVSGPRPLQLALPAHAAPPGRDRSNRPRLHPLGAAPRGEQGAAGPPGHEQRGRDVGAESEVRAPAHPGGGLLQDRPSHPGHHRAGEARGVHHQRE